MTDSLIRCENLWYTYKANQVTAIRNINIDIKPQEIIGVIGQNGSGKTTLVKHFNGLLKPTQGKVYVKGRDTTPVRVQELAADVGYVYQNPNHQLFARTVSAELEFGPRNLGVPEEEIAERTEKAIEFFNLQPYRDLHPYRIGFPLRKLVGMASIFTMRPSVFILDEPTTGQDNITTRTVYRLIERLRDTGATVVCVAHDMILLAEVVERMLVMRNSELIADASPREVFSNYEMMHSTHLTPPQITELSARLRKDKDDVKDVQLSVNEMVDYTLTATKKAKGGD
jgi:energy-coupling factor transport system ATP-binding protein